MNAAISSILTQFASPYPNDWGGGRVWNAHRRDPAAPVWAALPLIQLISPEDAAFWARGLCLVPGSNDSPKLMG